MQNKSLPDLLSRITRKPAIKRAFLLYYNSESVSKTETLFETSAISSTDTTGDGKEEFASATLSANKS